MRDGGGDEMDNLPNGDGTVCMRSLRTVPWDAYCGGDWGTEGGVYGVRWVVDLGE